jgi:putative ABC transport system permease protein
MTWLDALRTAANSLAGRGLRSALTSLGIFIGVVAVVATMSIGRNVSSYIEADIARLMSNGIVVTPEPLAPGRGRALAGRLTDGDGAALADEIPTLAHVAGTLATTATAVFGDKNTSVRIIGVDESYFEVRQLALARGRLWSAAEQARDGKVCVLGAKTAEKLFGEDDPIGHEVRVGAFSYRVLGVATRVGASLVLGEQDDRMFMPLGCFRKRVETTGGARVDDLLLSADSPGVVLHSSSEVEDLLRQRHRIAPDGVSDFRIRTQEEFRRKQKQVTDALSALLLTVAAISLLVAGIGVMNIMLVTVAERTREIGVRAALGAGPAEIRSQFLVESSLLCLAGALPGAAVGALVALAVGRLGQFPVTPSYGSLGLGLGASGVTGIVFGFLPARRAARMHPIEALRSDP